MNLPLLSASFLAFTLTLYVILDGFDLGVGILLLFQPAKAARDHMVDSITPTWDGNETWIIMAGVTLLAAFPIAYSILLPAFYLPVILMLLALGFRGVSFEFRVQSKQHRREWDVAFGVGSLVAALMQGLILGGLMQGVTVQNRHFAGSVLDIFRPLPIISGISLLFGYAVLGAGWLKLKSNVSLQDFANRSLRVSAPAFAVFFGIACIYAARIQPGIRAQWASHGIALACLVGLFAIAAGMLTALPEKSRPALPFLLGLLLFVVGISGAALIVFPEIVPFSVSLWDAASSSTSQRLVMIGAACVTPVVLAYSAFAYWIFRGKTPENGWDA
jgi:cytochrome bd ubiquinol oxidase subunit II